MKWEEFKRFLEAEGGLSMHTIKYYVCVARLFEEFSNGNFSRDSLVEFLSRIENEGSKKAYKIALKKFLEFLGMEELASSLRIPYEYHELEWWWTKDEVKRLFDACKDLREKVIVSLAYCQALRRSELASIKVEDIDLEGKTIRIRVGKRRGTSFIVKDLYTDSSLLPNQVELLKSYIEEKGLGPNDSLLGITPERISQIVRRLVKISGIRPANVHMLRHARLAHLRESGVPLDVLSRFVGHRSLMTTMKYAHISPKALREMVPPP